MLLADSFTFETDQPGTYYAESLTINGNCIADVRTPVKLTVNDVPEVENQTIQKCKDDEVTLTAGANVSDYKWSNGSTSNQITIQEDGKYSVELITVNGCKVTQNFQVVSIEAPVIKDVITSQNNIEVQMANSGDFSYSIDNINFTDSPVFENVEGGQYIIQVKENKGCGFDTQTILHLVVPDFFSPNGDGINDRLEINDVELSGNFSFHLFDRYGKLVFSASNKSFAWNGKFQGKDLPSSDYWYKLNISNQLFSGNITLKR